MTIKYSLSVYIPIYNEKELLQPSLRIIKTFVQSHFSDYELILIESGSTDGSWELCDKLVIEDSRLKVIHEGSRKGFGSAVKLGIKNASKDLIWLIPLDLPFKLDTLLEALPLLDTYDSILSFRVHDRRNLYRRFQSVIYNVLIKTILGLKVRQVNSAFKLYKRTAIQNIPLISNGWFIDTEIVYRLQEQNISFIEIPVTLIDRTGGNSSINASTFISVLKEMICFIRNKERHYR